MVLALCMLIDIYLHEVSWRYLEQVSRYRVDMILWQTSKGNNSKSINARVMDLAFSTSSHVDWLYDIYIKFIEDSLNGFQVTERTQLCDRLTDAQGKTICLPSLKLGGGGGGRGGGRWGGGHKYVDLCFYGSAHAEMHSEAANCLKTIFPVIFLLNTVAVLLC